MRGLSLVAASGGHSSSRCAGLSLSCPLLLRSTSSSRAGSVVVAHRPSCSAACGIFPDQGSNPCPLHWQADSQPLRHQGSPVKLFLLEGTKYVSRSDHILSLFEFLFSVFSLLTTLEVDELFLSHLNTFSHSAVNLSDLGVVWYLLGDFAQRLL